MANEFEGKIDAEGKFELTRSFWKTLKGTFALPQVSRRLAQAAAKKKVLDWYDIRDYPLDTAKNDEFITGFPSRGGDCILVLSITEGASAQIKFDNVNSDAFELANYRKLRHNFSNLYLNNAAQSGATLKILFGRGDWEVVRHHPEEEIVAINADTVDGLHASASIEAGSLLALGADGFFPCGAVRCLQNELFANQPATPVAGDVFISNDTGELYICFAAGVWTNILTPAADQIAFTPAGDIIATDVQAAIEELDAEKIADIADVIKDTHIDWGVGANQVSAADMPIADPGAIIVATQVEGALQEIMTDLNGFPDELKNLITHEIQQLETLGGVTTILAAQWAYLGAMDQGVTSGSDVAFASLAVDTNVLYVDKTNDRVGIGIADPAGPFEIDIGNISYIVIDTGSIGDDAAEPLEAYLPSTWGMLFIIDDSIIAAGIVAIRGGYNTAVIVADPDAKYSVADVDGKICIIADGDGTYSLKNRLGGAASFKISFIGGS